MRVRNGLRLWLNCFAALWSVVDRALGLSHLEYASREARLPRRTAELRRRNLVCNLQLRNFFFARELLNPLAIDSQLKEVQPMKYLIIAAALSLVSPGIGLAQTSAPSTNPSAHSESATSPNQPVGSTMTNQGSGKPCSTQASGTSDRGGGNEKASAASGGSDSNPNGKVSGGC